MTCNAFFRVTASERKILRPRLTWKLSLFCLDISAHVANSGKFASSEGVSACRFNKSKKYGCTSTRAAHALYCWREGGTQGGCRLYQGEGRCFSEGITCLHKMHALKSRSSLLPICFKVAPGLLIQMAEIWLCQQRFQQECTSV